MKLHHSLITLVALTGALILSIPLSARTEGNKPADEKKVQLMFVQTAEDLKTDGKTLRLVNVSQ
ncbi:MAG: hypothetical protein WCC08_20180 [Terrimicrobiaceae bacterium]